jgi:hypothetical protein
MQITKDSSKIVDLFSAVNMLTNHKRAILDSNGWYYSDYDERYTNQHNGCMMSHEQVNKVFNKYITKIQSSGYTSVDIFKIIYILLREIHNGVVTWDDGNDGDSW